MNVLHTKEGTSEPVHAEPTALEQAEAAVQAADKRLSDLHREFLEFQKGYRLLVDPTGNILQPLIVDPMMRADFSRKLHEHQAAQRLALWQFHQALDTWAKLQPGPG